MAVKDIFYYVFKYITAVVTMNVSKTPTLRSESPTSFCKQQTRDQPAVHSSPARCEEFKTNIYQKDAHYSNNIIIIHPHSTIYNWISSNFFRIHRLHYSWSVPPSGSLLLVSV